MRENRTSGTVPGAPGNRRPYGGGPVVGMNARVAQYQALVEERKRCQLCPGLTNPAEVAGGCLDSAEIGPYSLWQNHLEAELMVVAKDFAPVAHFRKYQGRPDPFVETNRRLRRFLALAGYEVGTPNAPVKDARVFFTNAVLCLSGGGSMRTTISHAAFQTCGRTFLIRLVDLIRPRVIITLGRQATKAVLNTFGVMDPGLFQELIRAPSGRTLPGGSVHYAVPHPVASVSRAVQEASWLRIRDKDDATAKHGT